MVVMAGCRLRGRRFDSGFGTFFFTPFFCLIFSPFAPPFQCSSIFLVNILSLCSEEEELRNLINEPTPQERTPLYMMYASKNFARMEVLLRHGAGKYQAYTVS